MIHRTPAEAEQVLRSQSRDCLLAECEDSYRDLYGVRSRPMIGWTVEQLTAWWLRHYQWDPACGAWTWSDTVRQRMTFEEFV